MPKSHLSTTQQEAVNEHAAAVAAVNIYRERRRLEEGKKSPNDAVVERHEPPDRIKRHLDLDPSILRPIAALHLSAEQQQVASERIATLTAVSVYRDLQRARATAAPSGYPGTIVGNCSSSCCREEK
jgi:hypothetical protein